MKKYLVVLLMLVLASSLCSSAFAAGMGVQVLGGPATETEPVSLDDLKLNVNVAIDGWGELCATGFEMQDAVGYYKQGQNSLNYDSRHGYYESGKEADYAVLYMDITNTAFTAKNYLANVEVKTIFDDVYEYGGWAYQCNYNNKTKEDTYYCYASDSKRQNVRFAINEADEFSINPMYQGHYLFGCTLPNAVVESKKPLRMVITIDGNEITYNIRK